MQTNCGEERKEKKKHKTQHTFDNQVIHESYNKPTTVNNSTQPIFLYTKNFGVSPSASGEEW